MYPQGFSYQTRFRLDPFPVFTYEVEGVRLEKSVFMVQEENTTVVQYEVHALPDGSSTAPIVLEVRPLIAFRDYHSTTHENGSLNSTVQTEDGLTTVKPYSDLPTLHLANVCRLCLTQGNIYEKQTEPTVRSSAPDGMQSNRSGYERHGLAHLTTSSSD
jgi:hypothetical protein